MDRSIDGFVRNTTLNRDEKGEDEQIYRAGIEWDINDDLSLYFKAERTEFDVQGRNVELFDSVALPGGTDYVTILNNVFQASFRRPPVDGELNRVRDSNGDFSNDTIDNYVLELDYQLGDHELTFLSGWLEYDHNELCDCDFTGASIFTADGDESFEQFSQEIRLTSPLGENFEYITGLYYQSSKLDFQDIVLVPTDSVLALAAAPLVGLSSRRTFAQDTDVWAAFFQGTWHLNDNWRLIAGGRYTSEDKNQSRQQSHFNAAGMELGDSDPTINAIISAVGIEAYDPIQGSRSESVFTPLVTLQWDTNDAAMLYASWTRGFKSGGFDVRSNAHPDPAVVAPGTSPALFGTFEFEEEEATNFEIGAKTTLLDGAAELNAALFFTDYEDLQVSQFDGVLGFNVTNAAEASIRGVELEGRWLAADSLTLSGSLSYLDFEYDNFPNSQCYFGQAQVDPGSVTDRTRNLCDVAGERKEYTPEWRATVVGDHIATVMGSYQLHTTVDVLYVDDYLWNPTLDPRSQQDAYVEVNARIGFSPEDGNWEIALLGKNLTNEDVVNFGGDAPLATRVLTRGGGNAYYGFINRDRSVAIQAKLNF